MVEYTKVPYQGPGGTRFLMQMMLSDGFIAWKSLIFRLALTDWIITGSEKCYAAE